MRVQFITTCEQCGHDVGITADVDPASVAPVVRGKVRPMSSALIYKITSDDIKRFLIDKAREFVPDVKMEVVPRYCEKKHQRQNEPHRSYASLRIAFSEHVIAKNADAGWFGKIGESSGTRVVKSLLENFVRRYQYDIEKVDKWLKNYKNLEELEESLGMSEAYINDLKQFVKPAAIETNNDGTWVFFSAAAENVIRDMLTVDEDNAPAGRIHIQDITQVSKSVVEWLVYLYPRDYTKENPLVKKMLLGEEKVKK